MDFVAIDVETANAALSSICQIGIAKFSNGKIIDEWFSLVNPEDFFDPLNIGIHGIKEESVADAPKFLEVFDIIKSYLENGTVVSHTQFYRTAIHQAINKYNLSKIDSVWIDSARIARRTWPELENQGYGLANVCEKIGYDFQHHHALEDAKAAGAIILEAAKIRDISIISISNKLQTTSSENEKNQISSPLSGEFIVFTGSLVIPRKQAQSLAEKAGCNVTPGVTKKTTILVVGDQDIIKLAGKDRSAKHLKAEKLISEGQEIRIIRESDFLELISF